MLVIYCSIFSTWRVVCLFSRCFERQIINRTKTFKLKHSLSTLKLELCVAKIYEKGIASYTEVAVRKRLKTTALCCVLNNQIYQFLTSVNFVISSPAPVTVTSVSIWTLTREVSAIWHAFGVFMAWVVGTQVWHLHYDNEIILLQCLEYWYKNKMSSKSWCSIMFSYCQYTFRCGVDVLIYTRRTLDFPVSGRIQFHHKPSFHTDHKLNKEIFNILFLTLLC